MPVGFGIGAETKNQLKKCIITLDTKSDIGEKSVDREQRNRSRQRPNAAPRSGKERFPLQGRIPELLEEETQRPPLRIGNGHGK
jgi:hypothetical protein